MHIPEPKECASCHVVKATADFCSSKGRPDGLNVYCRDCASRKNREFNKRLRERPEVTIPESKFCTGCKSTKNAEHFGRNRENSDGLIRHCRECVSKLIAERRIRYAQSAAILRADGKKRCKTCKEHKPIANFHFVKGNRDHLEDNCKPCSRRRASHRYLKSTYGLSFSEYQVMSEAQNHLCYLCNKPETMIISKDGTVNRLAVDHSHDGTGTIRKLLCGRCNISIGGLEHLLGNGLLDKSLKYLKDNNT